MARCIPDRLPPSASKGEQRLFKILSSLPDECIVYFEPFLEGRLADFVVLIPSMGLVVVEVKGWYPNDILGGDLETVHVINRGVEQPQRHPIRQAREYMTSLMRMCERHAAFRKLLHSTGKYEGRFIFPFAYFSILSNATRTQIEESGKSVIFPKEKVMTRDEFLAWESYDETASLEVIKSYFDPWWPIVPLTAIQIDTLRAIIHPEVILFSFMDESKGLGTESIKVLDVKQENHARNMGDGHRIIYGVPGSGKTVILVARAKLIALANPNKKHLFLCYNVALALHLLHLLKDHGNIVVRHFDRFGRDRGTGRKDREDNDSFGKRLLETLKLRNGHGDKYNSVFIDEAQDFAESWFRCALEVMDDPLDGDLLIVGDGNQGLYRHRDFTWASIGIQAVGRTINTKFDLDRCYRSTKEIMALAQAFATAGTESAEESIASMRVDSECCTRSSGFRPVVMECKDLEDECHYTAALVNELMAGKWFGREIPNPLHPSEIAILYREAGDKRKEKLLGRLEATIGKAIWVNRDRKSRERIIEPGVKIQTVHSSKGLQYKAVIVLWTGLMPLLHSVDLLTERRLLFVGLTRAEDYLTISYSSATPFVSELVATEAADLVQGNM